MCRATGVMVMMMATTIERAPRRELGEFLTEYAARLWGCGATCARIERNTCRIARAYGYGVELMIMPGHVSVVLGEGDDRGLFTRRMAGGGVNFDLNAGLSALSWRISDNGLPLAEARSEYDRLVGYPYRHGVTVLMLASVANAAFCRLFGGDWMAMGVVCGATMAGYFVKQRLLRGGIDNRVVFFVSALVSALLCCGASLQGWGGTPEIALATSVLYLIPGVPYINAASDLIDRHYLCALSRLTDAVVLTAALSGGLCVALWVMGVNVMW